MLPEVVQVPICGNYVIAVSSGQLTRSFIHLNGLGYELAKLLMDTFHFSLFPDTPGSLEGTTKCPGTASSEPLLPS